MKDDSAILRDAVRDLHWMARRYADMRSSYAPGMFNRHTRALLAAGVDLKAPHFARDGMGRSFDGLTEQEVQAAAEDMPRGFAPEPDERLAHALLELERLRPLSQIAIDTTAELDRTREALREAELKWDRLHRYVERICAADDHITHYAYGRTPDEQVGQVARAVMREYRAAFTARADGAEVEQ